MKLEFKKISLFNRGILLEMLKDTYSFDNRYKKRDLDEWERFDNFFFNNLDIADKYGFITTYNDIPIGFISFDPRNLDEYIEIGYNCIITKYKGNGYGKMQLQEAISRIKKYNPKKIIVTTDENLIPAQKMYESVGFKLVRKRKRTSDFTNGNIDYAIEL